MTRLWMVRRGNKTAHWWIQGALPGVYYQWCKTNQEARVRGDLREPNRDEKECKKCQRLEADQ